MTPVLAIAKNRRKEQPLCATLADRQANIKLIIMPTIEIASINSTGLGLNQADFDVAIIEENKLESHRGLFYDLLRQQNGVIVILVILTLRTTKKTVFLLEKLLIGTLNRLKFTSQSLTKMTRQTIVEQTNNLGSSF